MLAGFYIMEYNKSKEVYIRLTQALNCRISLHTRNIKLTENRKLNVLKHLYERGQGKLKFTPIYQTNDYTPLQIKEKIFIDKFKRTSMNYTYT